MNVYNTEEKVNFIKWYYGGSSLREVQATFAAFNPERPIPAVGTIRKIVENFENRGSVNKLCKCQGHNALRPTKRTEAVLLSVAENKNVSLREMGKNLEMHFTTAQKILKTQRPHFHSYKYARHQQIFDEDKENRMQFCETMMEKANNDRNFISQILFSDECTFSLNGKPNRQNYRYWSTENQHLLLQTNTQYRGSVNVWAGILGPHIIGPYFLPHRLNGMDYLNLLQEIVGPDINEMGINYEFWFQHDGCPVHKTSLVTEYLNDTFPNRWIGGGGEIHWPARSPDLAPNDFFLWGHLQDRLYKGKSYNNVEELKAAITTESRRISCYQLASMRRNFYDRLGYCLAVGGDLFEHLI